MNQSNFNVSSPTFVSGTDHSRRSANYKPNIWKHHFLQSLHSKYHVRLFFSFLFFFKHFLSSYHIFKQKKVRNNVLNKCRYMSKNFFRIFDNTYHHFINLFKFMFIKIFKTDRSSSVTNVLSKSYKKNMVKRSFSFFPFINTFVLLSFLVCF